MPVLATSDSISRKLIDRLAYSRDASIYRIVPEGIARPKNEKEVVSLFGYAQKEKTSVTFRAAGTSLSGQSVTNGIIAETVRDWKSIEVINNGREIRLEPGVIGEVANRVLSPYNVKIGPDPASIKAAMIGGIISNNASGMCCGTEQNSYQTLKYIRFILAKGRTYDTSIPDDYNRFIHNESVLANGLIQLKSEIKTNQILVDKIRHKYRIKNTLGYSLNAILDWKHPLDIFAHLLVGSEGTLAFVSNVTLETVPDSPHKATGLIIFGSIDHACDSIRFLKNQKADAVELMDYASLTTAKYLKNPPYTVSSLKSGSAALLCEFQRSDADQLMEIVANATNHFNRKGVDIVGGFQTNREAQQKLWQIRKGLYPAVGSLRKAGTSVITEDICFDIENLPRVINDLQRFFQKWNYDDSVIFGHAKDGNLHFVTSIDLETDTGVENYDGLIQDIVEMTVGKYDGSLKAEHGTGRNMAPFVEKEWGAELTEVMWSIKRLADPENILNPGVLLSHDKDIHAKNLKSMPKVSDRIDLCVECGFCEHVCPSRELTMTPRQRIILAREKSIGTLNGGAEKSLIYLTEETCAVDSLCETACPVNIDTGTFVKELRETRHSSSNISLSKWTTKHFSAVQSALRIFLRIMRIKTKFVGHGIFVKMSKILSSITNHSTPIWNRNIPNATPKMKMSLPKTDPEYVYFTTCINRVFNADKEKLNLADVLEEISEKSELSLSIPQDISDCCCGMPYTSKGYADAGKAMIEKTINRLYTETEEGRLPVLVDTSACAYQFITNGKYLSGESKKRYKSLMFVDLIPFLQRCVQSSSFPPLDRKIVLHPTCSNTKMELVDDLKSLAEICASEVILPEEYGCCGFAGDRGLLFPELTETASKHEANAVKKVKFGATGCSTSRTCEIGMMSATGLTYESIAILVRDYLRQK